MAYTAPIHHCAGRKRPAQTCPVLLTFEGKDRTRAAEGEKTMPLRSCSVSPPPVPGTQHT